MKALRQMSKSKLQQLNQNQNEKDQQMQSLRKKAKGIETMTPLSKYLHAFAEDSYSDYPDSVRNNARRGIELNEELGNKCATQVGKVRGQQLANKEPISIDTIKRMYSYLSRAEPNFDDAAPEDCAYVSFLLWGGKTGLDWAESKLKGLNLI
jgi:hypothetical protein